MREWPETFCYTLSEAVIAHIPVIGVDIGAIGERLEKLDIGWKVSNDNTVAEISDLLARLLDNKQLLIEKKNNAANTTGESVDDMLDKYRRLYAVYEKKNVNYPFADYEKIYKAYKKYDGKGFTGEDRDAKIMTELEINSLRDEIKRLNGELNSKTNEINMVYASRLYKLMTKIRRIIPGK